VALAITLMSLLLLSALGLTLVLTTMTETEITGNYRDGREALHATEAGLERAVQDLLTAPDWNAVLSGQIRSGFADGSPSGVRVLPDGSTLDLTDVLNLANCGYPSRSCSSADMDARTRERPWGVNNPRYQMYAYGAIRDILPGGAIDSKYYVVVMVGDDPAENDGNPLQDGVDIDNPGRGVLMLRAEGFGPDGAHAIVETSVAQSETTDLERGYTGQGGQDEQNRRARASPVQTPGKALTRSEMAVSAGGLSVQ